ncbi:MAG: nitrile hydratase subunit beta [Rubrivivax sp.]
MNGVHDLGGMQGFGPVVPEPDEPLFHAAWERRALGLTLAAGAAGRWNLDQSRAVRESLPPAQYLGSSYYQIWIAALERLVADPPRPLQRVLRAEDVPAVLAAGTRYERPATAPAAFGVGQRVRARNLHPRGHTRLPRYVRGHVGTVVAVRGVHVFPDTNVAGDERPQWLYTVEFEATELWGPQGDARDRVSVDAFEPYLEPA